jgi:Ser/Thr protein kinase RdoA (MazF antagonist)
MVALYTTWYNFARINSAVRMSPAMASGLSDRLWDIGDIVELIEEMEMKQDAIYEVAMQKDGQYQVIIRRPSAHSADELEEEAAVIDHRCQAPAPPGGGTV